MLIFRFGVNFLQLRNQSRGGVYSLREGSPINKESTNENSEDEPDESETRTNINAVIQSETEDLKSVISNFEENEVFELGIKLESGIGLKI